MSNTTNKFSSLLLFASVCWYSVNGPSIINEDTPLSRQYIKDRNQTYLTYNNTKILGLGH